MTEIAKVERVDPMLAMIEKIATDPDASIDKLERMLAMKERLDAESARAAFNDAFAACQAEIPRVIKNKSNDQTRSRYADLAAVDEIASPIITKFGFSQAFYPTASTLENHYGIDCKVSLGKHSETFHADIPADGVGMKGTANKTATHAFGSTMSYGRRYLMCMIWNIITADDDGNAASGKLSTVNEAEFLSLRDMVETSGADLAKFLLAYNAPSLEEFPVKSYAHAMAQLKRKAG